MPHSWLQAVAEFERDDAISALLEYFKYGWNNHSTYKIIAGLDHIDIDQLNTALPIAWETARDNNKHAMAELTPRVLELGYLPAFKFTIAALIDNAGMKKHWFDAHKLILRYTDQTGSPKDLLKWYNRNQYMIRFDPDKKIFTL